jgi:hypothetical protein
MTSWTPQELNALGRAREIRVAGRRKDGSPRTLVTVWHVVTDKNVYVRSGLRTRGQLVSRRRPSLRGNHRLARPDSRRHLHAGFDDDAAIDAAYFAKYSKGAPGQHITSATAKTTTLRIVPRGTPTSSIEQTGV